MFEMRGIRLAWAGALVALALLLGYPSLAWALDDLGYLGPDGADVPAERVLDGSEGIGDPGDSDPGDPGDSSADPVSRDSGESGVLDPGEEAAPSPVSDTYGDAAPPHDPEAEQAPLAADSETGETVSADEPFGELANGSVPAGLPSASATHASAKDTGARASNSLDAPSSGAPESVTEKTGKAKAKAAGEGALPRIEAPQPARDPVSFLQQAAPGDAPLENAQTPRESIKAAPVAGVSGEPDRTPWLASVLHLTGDRLPGCPEAIEAAPRRVADGFPTDYCLAPGDRVVLPSLATGAARVPVGPSVRAAVPDEIRCRSP